MTLRIIHTNTRPHLQQIRSPRPQCIPTLNKQRKHTPNSCQERHTSHIRHRLRCIIDVDQVIHDSAGKIAARQRIEGCGRETGDVAGYDSGGEEAEILETIGLRGFGADDAVFGLDGY